MHDKMRRPLLGILAVSTLLFLPAASICAKVVLADDFTQGSGQPIDRSAEIDRTGISANYWNWRGSRAHIEWGQIIATHSGQSAEGAIALAPLTADSGVIEIMASFRLNTSNLAGQWPHNQADWVAIGFLDSTKSPWLAAKGGNCIWAMVRPDGRWNVFEHGTAKMLTRDGQRIEPPQRGQLTTIRLKYDTANAQAALVIDGKDVSGWVKTNIQPEQITAVGFRINPRTDPNSRTHPRAAALEIIAVSILSGESASLPDAP